MRLLAEMLELHCRIASTLYCMQPKMPAKEEYGIGVC